MRNYNDVVTKYISGELKVAKLKLTTLEGCPEHITGSFHCESNKLASLIGGPQKVDGTYMCQSNRLTSLVGCASHIGDRLAFFSNPKISSLVGIHKIIKSCQGVWFDAENITQGGIGLLLIEHMSGISTNTEPFKIIRSYIGQGTKGMMECSKELISKGYANYAQL